MPVITCPTCGTKLEVDADQIGQSVQCGSCQQVFEAKTDAGSGRSRNSQFGRDDEDEDDRPSRRRKSKYRREYDDEYDDEYAPRGGGHPPPGGTGMGVTALVMGIAGLVLSTVGWIFCCGPVGGVCGILAIIFGIVALKTPGRGMGIAGIILGVLSLLAVVAVMVFWAGLNVWGRGFAPPPAAPPQPAPAVRGK
jgi:predicted Zn finger-like uncharacterized protein